MSKKLKNYNVLVKALNNFSLVNLDINVLRKGENVFKRTKEASASLATVYGMVLTKEGGRVGTWKRVDRDFKTVAFNAASHGTWAGMKTVKDGNDVLVEIPTTWVKSEVLQSGPYKGKTCWWTADGPVEGFHVHPAFMKPNGTAGTLRIGAYMARKGTSNQPMSTDGGATASNYWSSITYNSVHSTGLTKNNFSGKAGYRAYSIYDHHLLARLMLTEFGTPDVQAQTVGGVAWTGANRINYHGIYDPFGLPGGAFFYWLDGFTTVNGVYNVLSPTGAGTTINTGVSCVGSNVYPVNCRVDTANGVNFGDLFIASAANSTEANGSFADYQALYSGCAFYVYWNTNSICGAFFLYNNTPSYSNSRLGWRVAQVV
jgi:hypothetical protein